VRDLFTGTVTYTDAEQMWNASPYMGKSSSDSMDLLYVQWNLNATAFPNRMDNVASSMTLALRKPYGEAQPTASGTIYVSTSRAVVTWEWLTLPLFELVASLVFLITVIIQTRRRGLHPWMNNPLAYFFHGLDERLADFSGQDQKMRSKAKVIVVKFERLSEGGRLIVLDAGQGKSR
jgi:hypothetical protein